MYEDILTQFFGTMRTQVGSQWPLALAATGYDPKKTVATDTENLGAIDLGECTADAMAQYFISNMEGLHLMEVETVTVSTPYSVDFPALSGTLTFHMKWASPLKASVAGSIEAACGQVRYSCTFSGEAQAIQLTGTATGRYRVCWMENVQSMGLALLQIDKVQLNYRHIAVGLGLIGKFAPKAELIQAQINDLLGSVLERDTSHTACSAFNKALRMAMINIP
jgi:hypothetical protein